MKNVTTFSTIWFAGILICQVPAALGQPNSQGRPPRPQSQSPASRPRLKSATQQTYTAEQIREGEVRFAYVGANSADRPSLKAILDQLDAIAKTPPAGSKA